MTSIGTDLLGLAAAGLVLLTFSVRSLPALRGFAIASNLLFIGYGVAGDLMPILALHALLLPLNVYRLHQLRQTSAEQQPGASALSCAAAHRPATGAPSPSRGARSDR